MDSNHRRREPTDLQSVAFGRSATLPDLTIIYLGLPFVKKKSIMIVMILSCAIKYDGLIYVAPYHAAAVEVAAYETNRKRPEIDAHAERGFLVRAGRFLTPEQAFHYAVRKHQISDENANRCYGHLVSDFLSFTEEDIEEARVIANRLNENAKGTTMENG